MQLEDGRGGAASRMSISVQDVKRGGGSVRCCLAAFALCACTRLSVYVPSLRPSTAWSMRVFLVYSLSPCIKAPQRDRSPCCIPSSPPPPSRSCSYGTRSPFASAIIRTMASSSLPIFIISHAVSSLRSHASCTRLVHSPHLIASSRIVL